MVLINDNSTVLNIGDSMPAFTLPSVDNMTVESSMMKDPVIAVIFTCNHCPYAIAYEDRIIALAEKFDEEGCQVVLISSNDAESYPDDSFDMMHKKYEKKGYSFPYCYDETQEVAKAYGALCTPHCFVFDQARTLQYKGQIDNNWQNPSEVTQATLHDAIDALVHGNKVEVPAAHAIGCSIKWRQ